METTSTGDGYEVTRRIRREQPDGEHTWIIAMTDSALPGDRQRCLEAGWTTS